MSIVWEEFPLDRFVGKKGVAKFEVDRGIDNKFGVMMSIPGDSYHILHRIESADECKRFCEIIASMSGF